MIFIRKSILVIDPSTSLLVGVSRDAGFLRTFTDFVRKKSCIRWLRRAKYFAFPCYAGEGGSEEVKFIAFPCYAGEGGSEGAG